MEYGQDYDWHKPFFEQLRDLINLVPRKALEQEYNENSPYTNHTWYCNNIYLSYSTIHSENIWHSRAIDRCKDCLDCAFLTDSELCYQCLDSTKCYNSKYLIRCQECIDSAFLFDCRNCQNCFMSTNLRNRQYVLGNKQYTKKEYQSKLKQLFSGNYSEILKLKKEFINLVGTKALHKFANILKSINSSGENIRNSKNAFRCFDVYNVENIKYCRRVYGIKDIYDAYGGDKSELTYEAINIEESFGNKFITNCYTNINNLSYCDFCKNSSHLFGCVGLRNKQYCILNKQYTKEEYEKLVPKIIEHMNKMPYVDKKGRVYKYGEFFPPELSPFAYNETVAQEYFPLTKEEAIKQGYSWKDPEQRNIKPDIYTKDLPDNIKDVKDDIVGKVIQCAHAKVKEDGTLESTCNEQCTTGFKIIPQELEFYRKMNLPLPRLCPNCRHYQRLKQRNPLRLWKRQCMCGGEKSTNGVYTNTAKHFHGKERCPNEFYTTYSPDRKEIVYCEECYKREVG